MTRRRNRTADVAFTLGAVTAVIGAAWMGVAFAFGLPGWWWGLAAAGGLWAVGMAAEQGERSAVSRYRGDSAARTGGSERGTGPSRQPVVASRRYRATERSRR